MRGTRASSAKQLLITTARLFLIESTDVSKLPGDSEWNARSAANGQEERGSPSDLCRIKFEVDTRRRSLMDERSEHGWPRKAARALEIK